MTRDLSTEVSDSLDDTVVKPFYAVSLDFGSAGVMRMWTGIGDLSYGGNTYYGVGDQVDISAIEETSEISAKGVSVTVSGVPSGYVAAALSTPYQGRPLTLYFGTTVSGISTMDEVFSGYMDTMVINEGGETATIEVTAENKLIDLERPRVNRYTSSYQRSLYPEDRGLDLVEVIVEREILWGQAND